MNRSRALLVLAVVLAAAVGQLGGARPAAGAGGSFTDIDLAPGVVYGSTAWGDFDSDGDLDILLTGSDGSNAASKIYRNDGPGGFTPVAAGLTGVKQGAVAWGDYDSDGDLDILLTGTDGASRFAEIYRNNGSGSFTDIHAGLTGVWNSSVAWGDYDSDGDLDILLTGNTAPGGESNLVSKIYRNDGSGGFTDIGAGLPGVESGSVAWGDYDSDGDLDVLLTGSTGSGYVSKIYRNNGSDSFTEIAAGLTGVVFSSVAWGDYDSDGDLDILLTGYGESNPIAKIYRNDGGVFTQVAAGLAGIWSGSVAWGDYDADGDLDILLTGRRFLDGVSTPTSMIYRNDGGVFTDIDAGLTGVAWSSAAWGDYNSDGKLDILLTGNAGLGGETNLVSKIYRNNGSANAPPSAPGDLHSDFSDGVATLSWSDASDARTPSAALTYNLRVGTTKGGIDVVSPMVSSGGGRLLPQMGNVQEGTTAVLRNLPPGDYFWSVQAIDNNFAGSAFSDEGVFSVPDPSFAFSSASYSVGEGAGSASITIERSGSTAGSDTVHVLTADGSATAGSDYTTDDKTVSFSAGETSKTVFVPAIIDDALIEGDETVLLTLFNPSSGTRGNPYEATLTIRDNEPFSDSGAILTGVDWGSAAWGDYDNDGDLDILLSGCGDSTCSTRVSKIYKNNGGSFTSVDAGLTAVGNSSVAWGDYDSDGDLDILLTGNDGSGRISKIYKNNGGSFAPIAAGLIGVDSGSVAWGDYDSDGDLDILLSGSSSSGYVTKIYRNNGSDSFTEVAAGLTGVQYGSVAWGDYDSDGDLDILLTGYSGSGRISKIYRNDDGVFTSVDAGLTGVAYGAAAWGDYDSDGDLDILLSGGEGGSVYISKIYRNNGSGSFTEIAAGLKGVGSGSSAAWGDYDSDGDLDILLSGYTGADYVTKIYSNNGSGSFTEVAAGLPGVDASSVVWGDYDSDGKLDILLTGLTSGAVSKIYRNESDTANAPPSAPSGLGSSVSGGQATLSWSAAGDAKTPTAALTYNLRVGTTPGGSEVVSPMASSAGYRRLPQMGNAQEGTTAVLRNLPLDTYYWSVQAIDSGFVGSGFATEGSFTVAPVFALSATGYSVGEGGGTAQITINRTGLTSGNDSVQFATANGTATAGSDYTAVSQTVSFAAGETSKTVSVPITDDSAVESSETVQLSLSSPSSGATLASPSSATLTIVDNDVAPPPSTTTTTTTTPTTHPATATAKGKIASCKLSKTSFRAAQAGKVKLTCKFSPKSKILKYVLSLKKGKKWAIVKSAKKANPAKTYTITVKKFFAGKSVKRGQYRLKLSADRNSKLLKFKLR